MAKEYKLTQESYDKLAAELEYLRTVREKEIADQIKEARSFGDLSENSEYDEAKNEQGKMYSRKAELEQIIAGAVIINENERSEDKVSHGSRVEIVFEDDDEPEEYHIVGSQEANPDNGQISDESPIGKALMGHKVGDKVEIVAPAGKIHCTITKIFA